LPIVAVNNYDWFRNPSGFSQFPGGIGHPSGYTGTEFRNWHRNSGGFPRSYTPVFVWDQYGNDYWLYDDPRDFTDGYDIYEAPYRVRTNSLSTLVYWYYGLKPNINNPPWPS